MRSCLYLSLIAFTSGFVFRLFKVKDWWSCSFFRACCATPRSPGRSKEKYEFSEEKEEKEMKIRRKMKAESADPDSVDEAEL